MAPAKSASTAAGPALKAWRSAALTFAPERLGEDALLHPDQGGGVGDVREVPEAEVDLLDLPTAILPSLSASGFESPPPPQAAVSRPRATRPVRMVGAVEPLDA